jgi:hypothetical protein
MNTMQGGTMHNTKGFKMNWNKILNALILIKIGQDLGTISKSSIAVHDLIEMMNNLFAAFGKI